MGVLTRQPLVYRPGDGIRDAASITCGMITELWGSLLDRRRKMGTSYLTDWPHLAQLLACQPHPLREQQGIVLYAESPYGRWRGSVRVSYSGGWPPLWRHGFVH